MLSEFYCKYCGTTQYLKPRKNRVTCGNDECTKKKRALDLRENRQKGRKKIKLKERKKIKPQYGGDFPNKVSYKITPIKSVQTWRQWREYGTEETIGEIKAKKVFLFGKNYTINTNKSTDKALVTDETNGTYLAIYNYKVQIRDKNEPVVV